MITGFLSGKTDPLLIGLSLENPAIESRQAARAIWPFNEKVALVHGPATFLDVVDFRPNDRQKFQVSDKQHRQVLGTGLCPGTHSRHEVVLGFGSSLIRDFSGLRSRHNPDFSASDKRRIGNEQQNAFLSVSMLRYSLSVRPMPIG
ncbi:MAG: hypothetical protein AAF933_13255 [Pseudomonadota bacterium]